MPRGLATQRRAVGGQQWRAARPADCANGPDPQWRLGTGRVADLPWVYGANSPT